MMMRVFLLLILCWSFAHADYSSGVRLSDRRFHQRLHYDQTAEEQLLQILRIRGASCCSCSSSSQTFFRNGNRETAGTNQGYSAFKVADLRGGDSGGDRGGDSGVVTAILASPVTCVLAVIASVGLRILLSSGDSTASNHPMLVTMLQRLVNYYLIGYFFFALVQWQKRVQEQNSKRQ